MSPEELRQTSGYLGLASAPKHLWFLIIYPVRQLLPTLHTQFLGNSSLTDGVNREGCQVHVVGGVSSGVWDTQGSIHNGLSSSALWLDKRSGGGNRYLELGFGRCTVPAERGRDLVPGDLLLKDALSSWGKLQDVGQTTDGHSMSIWGIASGTRISWEPHQGVIRQQKSGVLYVK